MSLGAIDYNSLEPLKTGEQSLHTWSSEHRRRSRARSICFEWPHRGAAKSYRAESYGPFKLPIETRLCQR
jgi:hypothetical protein